LFYYERHFQQRYYASIIDGENLSECYYPLKLQYDGILEGKDMVVLWRAHRKLQF
jgi:hypothetical protein